MKKIILLSIIPFLLCSCNPATIPTSSATVSAFESSAAAPVSESSSSISTPASASILTSVPLKPSADKFGLINQGFVALDLTAAGNKGIKTMLGAFDKARNKDLSEKLLLSGDNYIVTKDTDLYLLNEKTSKETLLLKGNKVDSSEYLGYRFYKKIDDTKFIYYMAGYEWGRGCGYYDIAQMKDHPLDDTQIAYPKAFANNCIYTSNNAFYGGYLGSFTLLKTDITTLESVRLMKDIPDSILDHCDGFYISPNGKYMILLPLFFESDTVGSPGPVLYLYNLDKQSLVKSFTGLSTACFLDDNNLYVYDQLGDGKIDFTHIYQYKLN